MLTRTLISRALLCRSLKNAADTLKQPKRNAGHGTWSYRVPPPMPSKKSVIIAEAFGAVAWFWIMYHLFTEPEHVYGEWPYIDPADWTNAELGVPSDDVL